MWRNSRNTNFGSVNSYKNIAVYEIMWKILYSGQTANDNMVHVQFMLIPQATDTHSQYGTCAVHGDT